jgi:hypothetical protein
MMDFNRIGWAVHISSHPRPIAALHTFRGILLVNRVTYLGSYDYEAHIIRVQV